ncbi:hypothetical protein PACID_14740 [Acidipropionibacterium acidipropionici ATCC 4875]|uniref:Uncharacterized protein n=1 Tax=Acidipropionibacterium acidipropionici (strain ATCC 4875 / DSM 20272 / JCM 6432 / NBRC 12425 / NCIMB 8070 / 4) TaxID=1171373 RepID=K7RWG8_ACIA4|nr:hypothetical protein PACID_14740 [Acidipropionibacterium acidipropionici ATCC 4875]
MWAKQRRNPPGAASPGPEPRLPGAAIVPTIDQSASGAFDTVPLIRVRPSSHADVPAGDALAGLVTAGGVLVRLPAHWLTPSAIPAARTTTTRPPAP